MPTRNGIKKENLSATDHGSLDIDIDIDCSGHLDSRANKYLCSA